MMAPIFKKVAQEYVDRAVFVKVDTNAQYELSSKYQIRSLPTFMSFVGGRKWDEQKGGIGEQGLQQMTRQAVSQAENENVQLALEDLVEYYKSVDESKAESDIQSVYQKCLDMKSNKSKTMCQGSGATTLVRKLKKKYKKAPKTTKRFTGETKSSESGDDSKSSSSSGGSSSSRTTKKPSGSSSKPNLHLATKEQLQEELEKRLDDERDAQVEDESDEEDELYMEQHRWKAGPYPERVVVVGGGPAGMAAAIYAARAGLSPLVLAPAMGGQLQGKGVDVENYPGLSNITGPAVISSMRSQAALFGALFEEDMVTGIDTTNRPLQIHTNETGTIATHSVIIATGADSNWLGVPGEYEMRGGGVSSCATCDGFLFAGRHVIVVGGGDAAMEDALVLARTSKKVTVIHRRDEFRASKVLADRVKDHPLISIEWNTVVDSIDGKAVTSSSAGNNNAADGDEEVDLDDENRNNDEVVLGRVVTGVTLKDVATNEKRTMDCDAVFVAIGHTPNTDFLKDTGVTFDPDHPGYLQTVGTSTKTSVPGIFAAGDVSDSIYRQAITSAGSGAAAALDAERWLSEEGLGNEAAELEAELLAELMGDADSSGGAASMGYNAYDDAGGRMQGVKESLTGEL